MMLALVAVLSACISGYDAGLEHYKAALSPGTINRKLSISVKYPLFSDPVTYVVKKLLL